MFQDGTQTEAPTPYDPFAGIPAAERQVAAARQQVSEAEARLRAADDWYERESRRIIGGNTEAAQAEQIAARDALSRAQADLPVAQAALRAAQAPPVPTYGRGSLPPTVDTGMGQMRLAEGFLEYHAGVLMHELMPLGIHIRDSLRLPEQRATRSGADWIRLARTGSSVNTEFLSTYHVARELVRSLGNGASQAHANLATVLWAAHNQFQRVNVETEIDLNGFAERRIPPPGDPGTTGRVPPIPEPPVHWRNRMPPRPGSPGWDEDGFFGSAWQDGFQRAGFQTVPNNEVPHHDGMVNGRFISIEAYLRSASLRQPLATYVEQMRQDEREWRTLSHRLYEIGRTVPLGSLLHRALDLIMNAVKPLIQGLTEADREFPVNADHDGRLWVYARLCAKDVRDLCQRLALDAEQHPSSPWHGLAGHQYTPAMRTQERCAGTYLLTLMDRTVTALAVLASTFATVLTTLHNLAGQFVLFYKACVDAVEALGRGAIETMATRFPALMVWHLARFGMNLEGAYIGLDQLANSYVNACLAHERALARMLADLHHELQTNAPEFDSNLRDDRLTIRWPDPTQDVRFAHLINGEVLSYRKLVTEQGLGSWTSQGWPAPFAYLTDDQLRQITETSTGATAAAAGQLLDQRQRNITERIPGQLSTTAPVPITLGTGEYQAQSPSAPSFPRLPPATDMGLGPGYTAPPAPQRRSESEYGYAGGSA